jgi:hypothetical protein
MARRPLSGVTRDLLNSILNPVVGEFDDAVCQVEIGCLSVSAAGVFSRPLP